MRDKLFTGDLNMSKHNIQLNEEIVSIETKKVPRSVTLTMTMDQAVAFVNLFGRNTTPENENIMGVEGRENLYPLWSELYDLLVFLGVSIHDNTFPE